MARPKALKLRQRIARLSDLELLLEIDAVLDYGWQFGYARDDRRTADSKQLRAFSHDDGAEGHGDTMRAACEAMLVQAIERREAAEKEA